MPFDPMRLEALRNVTIGELLDDCEASGLPTRYVRDWQANGQRFMVVLATGPSADALAVLVDTYQAKATGPVVPLNRAQRRGKRP